ncbi:response regulator transcription factor [Sediminibacterium ginsengisoli]|uniref:DNA-binding response regulator, NarL/FixJ family, contains REC and HTH domains n=1 Tax=Sediminibacterium ginsengisoli TaxID=413434 RepID=A0A1T4KB76_9BACT|nr:response regulator transcription factor [Sediminibacterium ginsengisoli]SJZ39652.1 DNA-binding response regulator, NarL/FixJ family, contains REC and HTH domains [Sediminibacterium ginsengisoli]
MVAIALVEDHLTYHSVLTDFFRGSDQYSLDIIAQNGHDFIKKLQDKRTIPSVVLVDIRMPVMDGIALTHFLRILYPDMKVIGISGFIENDVVKNLFSSGASGYIMKARPDMVLNKALDTVMAGGIYVDERMADDLLIDLAIDHDTEPRRFYKQFGLTDREITFIMLNATSLTYEQIAETMFVEPKTVQTYFDRVSKKLHVNSRQGLTLFSLQNGLARLANYPMQH